MYMLNANKERITLQPLETEVNVEAATRAVTVRTAVNRKKDPVNAEALVARACRTHFKSVRPRVKRRLPQRLPARHRWRSANQTTDCFMFAIAKSLSDLSQECLPRKGRQFLANTTSKCGRSILSSKIRSSSTTLIASIPVKSFSTFPTILRIWMKSICGAKLCVAIQTAGSAKFTV